MATSAEDLIKKVIQNNKVQVEVLTPELNEKFAEMEENQEKYAKFYANESRKVADAVKKGNAADGSQFKQGSELINKGFKGLSGFDIGGQVEKIGDKFKDLGDIFRGLKVLLLGANAAEITSAGLEVKQGKELKTQSQYLKNIQDTLRKTQTAGRIQVDQENLSNQVAGFNAKLFKENSEAANKFADELQKTVEEMSKGDFLTTDADGDIIQDKVERRDRIAELKAGLTEDFGADSPLVEAFDDVIGEFLKNTNRLAYELRSQGIQIPDSGGEPLFQTDITEEGFGALKLDKTTGDFISNPKGILEPLTNIIQRKTEGDKKGLELVGQTYKSVTDEQLKEALKILGEEDPMFVEAELRKFTKDGKFKGFLGNLPLGAGTIAQGLGAASVEPKEFVEFLEERSRSAIENLRTIAPETVREQRKLYNDKASVERQELYNDKASVERQEMKSDSDGDGTPDLSDATPMGGLLGGDDKKEFMKFLSFLPKIYDVLYDQKLLDESMADMGYGGQLGGRRRGGIIAGGGSLGYSRSAGGVIIPEGMDTTTTTTTTDEFNEGGGLLPYLLREYGDEAIVATGLYQGLKNRDRTKTEAADKKKKDNDAKNKNKKKGKAPKLGGRFKLLQPVLDFIYANPLKVAGGTAFAIADKEGLTGPIDVIPDGSSIFNLFSGGREPYAPSPFDPEYADMFGDQYLGGANRSDADLLAFLEGRSVDEVRKDRPDLAYISNTYSKEESDKVLKSALAPMSTLLDTANVDQAELAKYLRDPSYQPNYQPEIAEPDVLGLNTDSFMDKTTDWIADFMTWGATSWMDENLFPRKAPDGIDPRTYQPEVLDPMREIADSILESGNNAEDIIRAMDLDESLTYNKPIEFETSFLESMLRTQEQSLAATQPQSNTNFMTNSTTNVNNAITVGTAREFDHDFDRAKKTEVLYG